MYIYIYPYQPQLNMSKPSCYISIPVKNGVSPAARLCSNGREGATLVFCLCSALWAWAEFILTVLTTQKSGYYKLRLLTTNFVEAQFLTGQRHATCREHPLAGQDGSTSLSINEVKQISLPFRLCS